MQKIWNIKDSQVSIQKELEESLKIHPLIAQLLVNRDIVNLQEARSFLSCDLNSLHDPKLFKNMEKVVQRLQEARERKDKVLIFGDYDVDGVTSSAILNKVLRQFGLNVIHHIPHRMHHGYGLNHEIGEFVQSQHIKLLVAIDCGITAVDEVDYLNTLGIDVIILDHHEPHENQLPNACAIMNPKQKDCPYPFKELASVGLAAKLSQALLGSISEEILDLVAIGTIADVVPLRGENRTFVKNGLKRIPQTKNKGLMALLEISKIKGKKISPYHVGFILGPRINATGRMDSAQKSLDLFLCEDEAEAGILAQVLEKHNSDRQKLQRNIVEEALGIVESEVNFKDNKVIVLSKEGWHKGILGIVASRLTDRFYRPSIVISLKDGVGTASARSIDGFHLHDVLQKCSHLLETFGGHEGAAGLTIKENNIDLFRLLINEVASQTLEVKRLLPSISIDAEVFLKDLNLDLVYALGDLEPFGEGNPPPVFCAKGVKVKNSPAILAKDTIKFLVSDGEATLSAVGFGMAEYKPFLTPGETIDIAFELGIDDWNKDPVVQIKLKDIRPSEI